MELQEFIEKLAEAIEIEDRSILSATTAFRELDDWNSLSALGVIALADEEFDVELSGVEMRQTNTIQELFDLICKKA